MVFKDQIAYAHSVYTPLAWLSLNVAGRKLSRNVEIECGAPDVNAIAALDCARVLPREPLAPFG